MCVIDQCYPSFTSNTDTLSYLSNYAPFLSREIFISNNRFSRLQQPLKGWITFDYNRKTLLRGFTIKKKYLVTKQSKKGIT